MTRKHFIAFANAIKAMKNPEDRITFIEVCIDIFSEANPRFNSLRFVQACKPDGSMPHDA